MLWFTGTVEKAATGQDMIGVRIIVKGQTNLLQIVFGRTTQGGSIPVIVQTLIDSNHLPGQLSHTNHTHATQK